MSRNRFGIFARRAVVISVGLALAGCSNSSNMHGGGLIGGTSGLGGGTVSAGGVTGGATASVGGSLASLGGAFGSGGANSSAGATSSSGATSLGGTSSAGGATSVGGATGSVAGAAGSDAGGGTAIALASVVGQVVDITGTPIPNVQVSGGGATATSAADGSFSLAATPGAVVVSFVAAGYVRSQKRATASTDGAARLLVTLATQTPPVTLDADTGGSVTGPRGSSLTAPAGAFVDAATGAAVSGTITISLTPLDPSIPGELAAYPGTLVAQGLDGSHVLLETTSVVDVDAEQNGHRLTVKPGSVLSLSMPGRSSGANPNSSGFWSFDETEAVWKQEGISDVQCRH